MTFKKEKVQTDAGRHYATKQQYKVKKIVIGSNTIDQLYSWVKEMKP